MFLTFDVGGTFTKYAWVTAEGEVLEKNKYPTVIKGENANLEFFADGIEKIYREYLSKGDIDGIAMSLPGQIDVDNGIVYGGGALGFLHEVHLGEEIAKRCDGIKVALENDGKCAALAEVWKGNASDCKDACVLIFGTGVGGGVVIDRKIHRGNRMLAGEFSFFINSMKREELDNVPVLEELKDLQKGFDEFPFLETTNCSSAALCYKASKIKGVAYDEISGEMIYKMAKDGDVEMQELLEDTYFNIAKLCIGVYVSYDPDIILIGGGISAEPAFVEGIQRYLDRMKKMTQLYSKIKIDTCKYRNDSNLLGAIFNFKQKYGLE